MKHRLLITTVVFSTLVFGGCDKGQTITSPPTPIPPKDAVSPVTVAPVTVAPVPVSPAPVSPISGEPILLKVVGNYNIVQFRSDFFAIPHGVSVNWEKDKVASLPGVLMAGSQEGVEALLPRPLEK